MECVFKLFVIVCLTVHVMANSINLQSNGDIVQGSRKTGQNKTRTSQTVSDFINMLYDSLIERFPDYDIKDLQTFSKIAAQNVKHYQEFMDAEKQVIEQVNSLVLRAWNTDSTLLKNVMKKSIEKTHYSFTKRDCGDLRSGAKTGLYIIYAGGYTYFHVMCNMDEEEGKWLVIQQRMDGSVDFKKTWNEYKAGFGSLDGEFWLGNDKIHRITSAGEYELRIDVHDWDGNKWFASYKKFEVGNESTNYKLTVRGYSGTAGDSMKYHNNMPFSTKDRDNDKSSQSCSNGHGGGGGWWFKNCHRSNLNGPYAKGSGYHGVNWYYAKKKDYSMKFARMMIRRV